MSRSVERSERRLLALEREASLRARLIARDERALVELVDLATPWLLAAVEGIVGRSADAEEIVLDTFRVAWTKIGTLPPDADRRILPWLFRIARNRAIDRLRARRRYRDRLERVATLEPDQAVEQAVEPDEAAQPGWHVHRQVHDALARLPDEQRAAVRLAYFHGLTHSEIAKRLDVPLGTVKTRLRLAFDKLRTALAPLKDWLT